MKKMPSAQSSKYYTNRNLVIQSSYPMRRNKVIVLCWRRWRGCKMRLYIFHE